MLLGTRYLLHLPTEDLDEDIINGYCCRCKSDASTLRAHVLMLIAFYGFWDSMPNTKKIFAT